VRARTSAPAPGTPPVDAEPPTPAGPTPAGDAARPGGGPNDRLAPAREWLVAELRDECSEIGVSARGFDLAGFLRGVQAFAREARGLGAPAERMLVLLKQCLADERLPREDREVYQHYYDAAMSTAIGTYYAAAAAPLADAGPAPTDDARDARSDG
jgi:hypothetical protein